MNFENPLLVREVRRNLRGRRAFIIPTCYALFLSAIFLISYSSYVISHQSGVASPYYKLDLGELGKAIFWGFSFLQVFLTTIMSASFTSNAITLEKRQKTFGSLIVTLLNPRIIILGKLLGCLSVIGLLIISSLPLFSICLVIGGVSPLEVLVTFLLSIILALTFGSLGLLSSTLAKPRGTTSRIGPAIAVIFLLQFMVFPFVGFIFSFSRMGIAYNPFTYAVSFYEPKVPICVVIGCIGLFLTSMAIITASRKLYSKEPPALSRRQYLVFFTLALFLTSGLYWTYPSQPLIPFCCVTLGLLCWGVPLLTRSRGCFRKTEDKFSLPGGIFPEKSSPYPFVVLLIGTSLFLLLLSLLLGENLPKKDDLLMASKSFAIILASALLFTSLGEFLSTIFGRRNVARWVSYGLIFLFLALPAFAFIPLIPLGLQHWNTHNIWLMVLSSSPFLGIISVGEYPFVQTLQPFEIAHNQIWLISIGVETVLFLGLALLTAIRIRHLRRT